MNELSRHIEVLLFENDCVIIPNFGGFVTHYTPSKRDVKENLFIPPTRVIGFNDQLKLNDGLLVQSFMSVYNTSFSDASKMIDKEVEKIKEKLFEEGKVEFPNIGELYYTINGSYEFQSHNNKLITPSLYGLDTFEILELSDLPKQTTLSVKRIEDKKNYNISINRTAIKMVASIAAVIFLFFFFTTPIENTDVVEGNYAQLSFTDLLNSAGEKPLTLALINVNQDNKKKTEAKRNQPIKTREIKVPQFDKVNAPTNEKAESVSETIVAAEVKATSTANNQEVKEVEKEETTTATQPSYHVIVASCIPLEDAQKEVSKLKEMGYSEAQIIHKGEKIRISILNNTIKEEAYKELNKIRSNEKFYDAWIFTY